MDLFSSLVLLYFSHHSRRHSSIRYATPRHTRQGVREPILNRFADGNRSRYALPATGWKDGCIGVFFCDKCIFYRMFISLLGSDSFRLCLSLSLSLYINFIWPLELSTFSPKAHISAYHPRVTPHFVPGHFVLGHFVPGHFVPVTLSRSLCPLITLSLVTLSLVTLSHGHFFSSQFVPQSL
jgi:hypothetical protein